MINIANVHFSIGYNGGEYSSTTWKQVGSLKVAMLPPNKEDILNFKNSEWKVYKVKHTIGNMGEQLYVEAVDVYVERVTNDYQAFEGFAL